MFCGKCGEKNADDAMFCSGCGTKLSGGEAVKSGKPVAANTDKKRKMGIIPVVVIMAAVIGLASMLFGGRSEEDVVEQFVNAVFEPDAEVILDLMPKKVVEIFMKEENMDKEAYKEFIQEGNKELQKEIESLDRYLGEGWKVTYEITSIETLFGDDLKESYEVFGIEVSEAKNVKVKVSVITKGGTVEEANTLNVALIKVGRSWCLDVSALDNLF